MSQIEFVASSGFSFTVALRNPNAAYASLATGLAVTQVTPGVYRCDTEDATGVVYVEAVAGALRVVGFANLSEPGANGYSEVFDSLAEAVGSSDAAAIADAVWDELLSGHTTAGSAGAKLSLVGTGSATTSSPVTPTGTINPITIGDDYLAIHSRVFEWTVDKPAGFNLTDATCWFGAKLDTNNKFLVSGSITDLGSNRLKLTFELPKAKTKALKPGNYDWSVAVHDAAGNEITRVKSDTNSVTLALKFTNATS